MTPTQRCRSFRLKELTHAACHQAVAGLGDRTRHEGQQCEVSGRRTHAWPKRTPVTAYLRSELAVPTIGASRSAPKPPDNKAGCFALRIYEAAVHGHRRSAITCRSRKAAFGVRCATHRYPRFGDRRGRDDVASDALRTQVPPDHEPTRPRLVHHAQAMALANDLAQRLVQRNQIATNGADVPDLAVSSRLQMSMLSLWTCKPTSTVLDFSMARRLASPQRPDRPPVRCIGVDRRTFGAQPTIVQGAGRPDSRSHLV